MLRRVADGLRPVAELAAERGVRLAIEPLNRYETSLINTVEQGIELLEAADHPACGLLLDSFHMNIEEKDPAAAAGPRRADRPRARLRNGPRVPGRRRVRLARLPRGA